MTNVEYAHTEYDSETLKRAAKIREAASLICNVYPNTAGKPQVIEAYARQLAPYPYQLLGEVATLLPATHLSEFCPTIPDILGAMVGLYRSKIYTELTGHIARVYRTRYIAGDEKHERGFASKFREQAQLDTLDDRDLLRAIRDHVRPIEYVVKHSKCRIEPRVGGPIQPPPKREVAA